MNSHKSSWRPYASNLWNETVRILSSSRSEDERKIRTGFAREDPSTYSVGLPEEYASESMIVSEHSRCNGDDDDDQEVFVRPKPCTPSHSPSPSHSLSHSPSPPLLVRPASQSPGIASEGSNDSRLTSILIEEDLKYIQHVTITDTIPFVPNLRYGKVLSVSPDGCTLVVAARIFNGYTTVLSPHTYRFTLVIDGICIIDREAAYTVLTHILLNKIVYVPHLYVHPDTGNLHTQIYIGDVHINQWMVKQKLATLDRGIHR